MTTDPHLTELEKTAIIRMKKKYEEYKREVEAVNRDKPLEQRQYLKTLTECIDIDLLEEILHKIEFDEDNDDIDEVVADYLDGVLTKESFDTQKLNLAEDLGKNVFLDSTNDNVEARVMNLRKDIRRTLKENGLLPETVFADEVLFGNIVKLLVDNTKSLNPPEIRAWMKHKLENNRGKMLASDFSNTLESKLKELEGAKLMRQLAISFGFIANHNPSDSKNVIIKPKRKLFSGASLPLSKGQSLPNNSKKVRFDISSADSSSKPNGNGQSSSSSSNMDAKDKKSPKPKCWACGGDHHLNFCQSVTDEKEREAIVEERKKNKPSRSNNTSVINPYILNDYIDCRSASKSPTSYTIKLDGVDSEVLLDNGSDRSLISERWLREFEKSYNKKLDIFKLDDSVLIRTVDPTKTIETDSYTKLSLTFKIYQDLHLRERVFFIVKQDIGIPIIGHSELSEIGIDPISTIERLSTVSNNQDFDDEIEMEVYSSEHDFGEKGLTLDIAIQQMLMRAKRANMPEYWWKKLCTLVKSYRDIFRVELAYDEPSKVTPMDVAFKKGAENVEWNSYNQKYTVQELKWLKEHIAALEKYGFIYRNPDARYASPALVVPKPGHPGEYRLCVDVKRPNSLVSSTHWPMPHIDVILRKLNKSSVYAKLDAFKGYWMFPVTPQCGELYSIKTPFGVFTPRRIVQGAQESVRYFQAGMEEALDIHSRDDLLLWVDDVLSHASTPEKLLDSLAYIFRCCRDRKICLSARKCELYLTEVTWCGRTISSKGIGFNPEYIQGIKDLEYPKTVGDLQKYICSMNWIRSAIPNYNAHMANLMDCLRVIIAKIGSNKKKVLDRRPLSQYEEWNDDIKNDFAKSKQLLENCIVASHYDPAKRLCVFPDASDKHWGLFITQVPKEDLSLPFDEQRHSPLLMMSGSFKSGAKNWHIKEKEAYPILVALEKSRDILRNPDGFSLFTDHKNLVFILDSDRRQVFKHADDRLSRWAMTLMSFNFTLEHISGEDNVVADMLSRWKLEHPQTVCGASFQPGECSTIVKEEFIWPDLQQIRRLQESVTEEEKSKYNLSPVIIQDNVLLVTKSGKIFIPDLENIRTRLCVIAHCGLSGHRGIKTTFHNLKKFYWPEMLPNVKTFCRQCLHCEVADSRKIIPRPFGEQMHAEKVNQILHYDFIQIGPSKDGYHYILVIKDDFSGYIDLFPCKSPNSEVVIQSLLKWYSLFGVSLVHISDQGSHFKNSVVQELNRRLATKHHFTLPYAPWSNGTVEVVNRELRELLRVWVSEFRMDLREWPSLIPLMVHVLNFSVSPRTGYPPALLFGHFSTVNNIDFIFSSQSFKQSKASFDTLSKHVESLRNSLENLHKAAQEESVKRRGHYKMPRNRPNFDKGDFVMFATRRNMQGPSKKSKPRWTGPYRIVNVESDWDFEIEHLVTNEKFHAHSSRLKFYCDKDLNITADLKFQITHDEMRYKIEKILDHSLIEEEYKFLILWQGFDKEDATWEPISVLLEDVPVLLKTYILKLDNKDNLKKALLAYIK